VSVAKYSPTFRRITLPLYSGSSSSTAWPWWRRQCDPSKSRYLFINQHGVTNQKALFSALHHFRISGERPIKKRVCACIWWDGIARITDCISEKEAETTKTITWACEHNPKFSETLKSQSVSYSNLAYVTYSNVPDTNCFEGGTDQRNAQINLIPSQHSTVSTSPHEYSTQQHPSILTDYYYGS